MQLCGRSIPVQQALFLLNLVCMRHLGWILFLSCLLCFLGQNSFEILQEKPAEQQDKDAWTNLCLPGSNRLEIIQEQPAGQQHEIINRSVLPWIRLI